MASILLKSHAKLNLRLKVIGKRNDNYHNLSMWNIMLDLHDKIALSINEDKSRKIIITIYGEENKNIPLDHNNLAFKAADKFLTFYSLDHSVAIEIEKNIPSGGGLGGGSSNAATVLKGLNKLLFDKDNIELETLTLGLEIGTELPYCLTGGFQHVQGVGDIISNNNQESFKWLNDISCALIFGLPPLLTSNVFKTHTAYNDTNEILEPPNNYSELIANIENDLIKAASQISPALNLALSKFKEVFKERASMTGSGSTLFILPAAESGFSAGEERSIYDISHNLGLRPTFTNFIV